MVTVCDAQPNLTCQPLKLLMVHNSWFAYDIISAILSGKPMGFIKERKDVGGLIASFATVVSPLEFLGRVPKLSWLARKTWLGRRIFYAKAGDKSGIGILMAVFNNPPIFGGFFSLNNT